MNKFRNERLQKPNPTLKMNSNDGDSRFSQAPEPFNACVARDEAKEWLAGKRRGKSDSRTPRHTKTVATALRASYGMFRADFGELGVWKTPSRHIQKPLK
jgi:hypothetical protein